MRLSLQARLAAFAIPIAACVTALLLAGLWTLPRLNRQLVDLQTSQRVTLLAERLARTLDSRVERTLDVIEAGGPGGGGRGGRDRLQATRAESERLLEEWRHELDALPRSASGERRRAELKWVGEQYSRFALACDQAIRNSAHDRPRDAVDRIRVQLDPNAAWSLRSALVRLAEVHDRALQADLRRARASLVRLGTALGIGGILILLVTVLTPWGLSRWMAAEFAATAREAALARADSDGSTMRSSALLGLDAMAPLDEAELFERFEGNVELIAEVLRVFRQESPSRLQALRAAVAQADCVSLARGAHCLKGALATMAAGPSHEIAEEIETLANSGRLEEVSELITRLERELVHVEAALAGHLPSARAA